MPHSPSPRPSFLARHSIHPWIPNSLIVLMMVFFMVPFALRGARMALAEMKNDVKDWLPADFQETVELEWFGKHFVGERFVLLTWPGCTEDSPKAKLLVSKLQAEALPRELDAVRGGHAEPTTVVDESLPPLDREIERARRFGDRHALFTGDTLLNWGGQNEKWLESEGGDWYYVLPNGEVYRWSGRQNMMGWIGRGVSRLLGHRSLEGEHLASFGKSLDLAAGTPNPIYSDPRRLTARLFRTVETGPDMLHQLSDEGGPLWPFGDVAEEYKPIKARRDALERLTGSMFAPAVPEGFGWSVEEFKSFVPAATLAKLPDGWEDEYRTFVRQLIQTRYEGEREQLVAASSSDQAEHWYALFDQFGVQEPARQTALVVTLSEVGKRNLTRVLGRGLFGTPPGHLFELASEAGISPPSPPVMVPPPFSWFVEAPVVVEPAIRIGGPPVDNVAIDEEGRITQVRLLGYSVFLGLVLSFLCFRSIKITTMVFFVGGISAVASVSMVWWGGSVLDAVLLSMPPLVYVLGLSGAVHIVNYYRDAVETHGVEGAPERALSHGWWPCTLASTTTAIGLLSLYTSNIIPIRKFGLFSAIGVMATLLVLFLYLPAALQTFVPKFCRRRTNAEGDDWLTQIWTGIGLRVVRHYRIVSVLGLALLLGVGFGVTKINTSVQLLKLFDSEAKIIKDYEWLEANVGKLVPMELVVRISPEWLRPGREQLAAADTPEAHRQRFQLTFLERAELAARVQQVVEAEFGEEGRDVVGRAMSAVTMLPTLPRAAGASAFGRDYLERTKFLRDMEQGRKQLMESDFLRLDEDSQHEGSELWRVSLRVGALADVDYGLFVHDLKDAVEPVMTAYRFRSEILHAIDRSRGGAGFWKTAEHGIPRVLVLGAAEPHGGGSTTTAGTAERNGDNGDATPHPRARAGRVQTESLSKGIDQTEIFTGTLKDLLTNASFRKTTWHDPHTKPVKEIAAEPEQWGKLLASYDAVVLVGDHADYDVPFIAQHAPAFVDARRHRFESGMETANQQDQSIHTVYTGLVPVVYKAQRTLLTSLIDSIGWAFVLIACVMSMLLNPGRGWSDRMRPKNLGLGVGAGLSSMLPNVFPVAVIFGTMGYLGIRVDIGSMMTASVAMGVAVDDTIHFLTWYRDGIRKGMRRQDAIVLAYKRCAAAMTQTTLIGGLGLSVFALSTFTPTQQFGTLMLCLLTAALVGDLLFLPALLAGPLGKLFSPDTDPAALPAAMPSGAQPGTRDESLELGHRDSLVGEESSEQRASESRGKPAHPPHSSLAERDSRRAVATRRDDPH